MRQRTSRPSIAGVGEAAPRAPPATAQSAETELSRRWTTRSAGSGSHLSRSGAALTDGRFYRTASLSDHRRVFRYVLAPINADAAQALSLPRTLPRRRAAWRSPSTTGPIPRAPRRCWRCWRAAGARATFFVIGEQVRAPPGAGGADRRRGPRGGAARLSPPPPAAPQRRRPWPTTSGAGAAVIEDAIGAAPAWHRPPVRDLQPGRPARRARRRACRRCCGHAGARTGASSRRPGGSPRRATRGRHRAAT